MKRYDGLCKRKKCFNYFSKYNLSIYTNCYSNSQQIQFNENIDKIKKDFLNFAKHMKSYTDLHIKLGKSLNSTVNHYKSTNTKYKQINKDVKQITSNEVTLIEQDQQLEDVENPDLE